MEMIKALNLEPPSGKLLQEMRGSYIHSPLPSIPVHDPVVVVVRDGQPDQNVLPSTQGESGLPADPLRLNEFKSLVFQKNMQSLRVRFMVHQTW